MIIWVGLGVSEEGQKVERVRKYVNLAGHIGVGSYPLGRDINLSEV